MSNPSITIGPAEPGDLAAILDLLSRHGLPHAGLAEHLGEALLARRAREVVASAALEIYGAAALLRSVAVAPELRGQGIGAQIVGAALARARELGVQRIYLLTTSAADYFPRFGFRPIARAAVQVTVQASAEFTGACPASASVLAYDLA
ncbi:MAG: GNAT family N-acetyltransferase [Oscillochloris sp.]|nr:GNAT family N-acetyltransferase [Oscillochloris sp.]